MIRNQILVDCLSAEIVFSIKKPIWVQINEFCKISVISAEAAYFF